MSPASSPPNYTLLYHPSIPGRGEFIRLLFEATGTPYADPANSDPPTETGPNGYGAVQASFAPSHTGDSDGNPPAFAPPALRVTGAGRGGKDLVMHQTANILMFLGERLGLVGGGGEEEEGGCDKWVVGQVAMTALDCSNECHDTHHPVAVMKYYEEQKDEALKKAFDFRTNRIPKFFSYFERVLKSNEALGNGKFLVGDKLTYADTTVWQVLDGLKFAFPKELEAREKDYPLLFQTFYPGIKEEGMLKEYLGSKRRLPYSMGLFRYYPELDRQ